MADETELVPRRVDQGIGEQGMLNENEMEWELYCHLILLIAASKGNDQTYYQSGIVRPPVQLGVEYRAFRPSLVDDLSNVDLRTAPSKWWHLATPTQLRRLCSSAELLFPTPIASSDWTGPPGHVLDAFRADGRQLVTTQGPRLADDGTYEKFGTVHASTDTLEWGGLKIFRRTIYHKMAVLDVSQNVDRSKNSLGILPCITPEGATSRPIVKKDPDTVGGIPKDGVLGTLTVGADDHVSMDGEVVARLADIDIPELHPRMWKDEKLAIRQHVSDIYNPGNPLWAYEELHDVEKQVTDDVATFKLPAIDGSIVELPNTFHGDKNVGRTFWLRRSYYAVTEWAKYGVADEAIREIGRELG
ncbi:Uu.00g111890.m01.CDS01 [Anthostomella pinea]|uniref:Uu.00g111890.m01.CDS01 n=1 Tax=Anthostomella pinea TaxID=933095 RepID=A0AAI8YGF0_9PEZI|nr:Uu.00g111890.m01.CDS01 [Anthostomella pinea]